MSLSGYKVVDLTRIVSGPFCTQLLADLGADVIKIETPKGDPLRDQGAKVNDLSWYFASFNRNKRSVVIDLYTEQGKDVLKRILSGADVLVENFRPRVLSKMGLSHEDLKQINSDLIVCHISGFGADGPYAQRPAFDFIAQALSGFMSVNGNDGDAPLRSGLPISDLVAGLYGALGIVSRLAGRKPGHQNGEIQSVDVSLTDSMVSLLSYVGSDYLAAGKTLKRSGNDHPLVAPYGVFETQDTPIALAPSNDGVYAKLLKTLNMEHLQEDPRFGSNDDRMLNRDALREIFEPVFLTGTSGYWINKLNAAGVPVGPIHSIPDVFDDPQINHRNMTIDVDHGEHGVAKLLGFPIKFNTDPCEIRHPSPKLGEHTSEILTSCGYDKSEIKKLAENGTIQIT